MKKEAIIKKWNTFIQLPFPEIDNVNLQFELTEIDSFSAGCITRYLDGELDQECISILKQSLVDLSTHLNEIKGKEKSYFMLLHEIINDIKEHKGF